MDLKVVAGLVAGVAVGFVLGGLGPRRQVQQLEQSQVALEAALEARGSGGRENPLMALLPGLSRRVGQAPVNTRIDIAAADEPDGPMAESAAANGESGGRRAQGDVAVIGATRPDRIDGPRDRSPTPQGTEGPSSTGRSGPERDGEPDRPRRRGRERLADFDRFASAQAARIAATRAALVEQADLSDEQVAEVDAATARMNGRLSGYGEEIITQMDAEEPPGPSQALGLGHDVSGILYEGQQELDRIVGDQTETVDPEARAIWNFVDVEQWRPFVEARQQGTAADDSPSPPPAAATADGAAGTGGQP